MINDDKYQEKGLDAQLKSLPYLSPDDTTSNLCPGGKGVWLDPHAPEDACISWVGIGRFSPKWYKNILDIKLMTHEKSVTRSTHPS